MMDEKGFQKLVAEIEGQGYDRATAENYAVLVGDTPIVDKDGSVLVMDGASIVARLKPLKFFES